MTRLPARSVCLQTGRWGFAAQLKFRGVRSARCSIAAAKAAPEGWGGCHGRATLIQSGVAGIRVRFIVLTPYDGEQAGPFPEPRTLTLS